MGMRKIEACFFPPMYVLTPVLHRFVSFFCHIRVLVLSYLLRVLSVGLVSTGKRVPVTPQGRCGKNTCVAPEVFYDEVRVSRVHLEVSINFAMNLCKNHPR